MMHPSTTQDGVHSFIVSEQAKVKYEWQLSREIRSRGDQRVMPEQRCPSHHSNRGSRRIRGVATVSTQLADSDARERRDGEKEGRRKRRGLVADRQLIAFCARAALLVAQQLASTISHPPNLRRRSDFLTTHDPPILQIVEAGVHALLTHVELLGQLAGDRDGVRREDHCSNKLLVCSLGLSAHVGCFVNPVGGKLRGFGMDVLRCLDVAEQFSRRGIMGIDMTATGSRARGAESLGPAGWSRPGGGHESAMTDSRYSSAADKGRDTTAGQHTIDWDAVRAEVGE